MRNRRAADKEALIHRRQYRSALLGTHPFPNTAHPFSPPMYHVQLPVTQGHRQCATNNEYDWRSVCLDEKATPRAGYRMARGQSWAERWPPRGHSRPNL